MSTLSINAFAFERRELHEFVYPNGKVVYYYLDDDNMPYLLVNGEVVYTVLPLEHLRVTDTAKIAELNAARIGDVSRQLGGRSVPTNYYDISNCLPTDEMSPIYNQPISFLNTTQMSTMVLKLQAQHEAMRVKIDNIIKEHFWPGTTIDLRYYVYYQAGGWWDSIYLSNKNCTGVNGFGFQHDPSIHDFGQFDIIKNGGLQAFDVHIWTTYVW